MSTLDEAWQQQFVVDSKWVQYQLFDEDCEYVQISVLCIETSRFIILYDKASAEYNLVINKISPRIYKYSGNIQSQKNIKTRKALLNDDTVTITDESVLLPDYGVQLERPLQCSFSQLLVHMRDNGWKLPLLEDLFASNTAPSPFLK